MLDAVEKRILDKLSDLMTNSVGICRADGTVLYPDNSSLENFYGIKLTGSDFLYEGGFGFMKCNLHFEDNVYLFLQEEKEKCRQLLEIACLSFIEDADKINREKEDFFRNLMINGAEIDISDEAGAENQDDTENSGYAVIYVRNFADNNIITENMSEVVKNIFPQTMGFETVPIERNAMAIVSFISENNTFSNVCELAEAVGETVLAETMSSVCVSIGKKVHSLEQLKTSYESAVTVCRTGMAFGITQGCITEKKLGIAPLLYSIPEGVCKNYIENILGPIEKEEKNGRELIYTVNCFLENNQNISETSRILYVHRNTLMYRLDKFNKLTGLDCTKFDDGLKIRLAIMLYKYRKTAK